MKVTILCALVLMAALFLMIWVAVALVQEKKLFTTAPKDIQAAAKEHPERFPGAKILGWTLLVPCVLAFVGAFVYAGWDGIQKGFGFWQFFGRFLTMLYLEKAFDILCLDWFLLTKSHFFQHYYPETVEDVSLVEGMKELYPIYRVIGKIPALRNLSNKLAVLEVYRNGE